MLRRSFAADFVEHSPLVADGLAGLGTLVEEAGPSLRHDVACVLVDGDLVALHGAYPGLADDVLIGFDIYRVAGGEDRRALGRTGRGDRTQPLRTHPVGRQDAAGSRGGHGVQPPPRRRVLRGSADRAGL
ncbi:hypothetical protein [Rothia kristinae]|uniref:hypothetical protein n=1 Tax=Rothia kristinae TaxID=37923 RepID=UPI00345EFA5D